MHCDLQYIRGGGKEKYACFKKEWMLKRDYDFEYRHGNNRLYISWENKGAQRYCKQLFSDSTFFNVTSSVSVE